MEHISRSAMKSRVMETGQKMIVTTAVLWMMYAGNWHGMKILALWKKFGKLMKGVAAQMSALDQDQIER